MKNIMKIKALALFASLAFMASCSQDQEVSEVMDPSTKPLVTITAEGDVSTATEGDTLYFTITTDKMFTSPIDFTVVVDGESVGSEADFEVIGGTLPAYTSSTEVAVVILEDNFPEVTEALQFSLGAFNIAQNWRMNPASAPFEANVAVENVNQEGVITVALSWPDPDHHIDLDFYIIRSSNGSNWGGNDAATGANPEINVNLWPDDPNDTYYILMDPYELDGNPTVDYTISLGFEDGSVETYEGTFDTSMLDSYTVDFGLYRLMEITILDGTVTVEHLL